MSSPNDKGGSKLKESVLSADAAEGSGLPSGDAPNTAGLFTKYGPGPTAHWVARRQTIGQLIEKLRLPTAANRIVIDKTALTGRYDFTLDFEITLPMQIPPGAFADQSTAVPLPEALREQLGLRLVDGKQALDIVIIDSANRIPTNN